MIVISKVCRKTRRLFPSLAGPAVSDDARVQAARRHLGECRRCDLDYRASALSRTVLDLAAAEAFTPDKDFYTSLRARIARGPESPRPAEESWASAVLLTARQLVPAMAMLLALIIGASFLIPERQQAPPRASIRPSERVLFGDAYEITATHDDVLETLVAVEENENGR